MCTLTRTRPVYIFVRTPPCPGRLLLLQWKASPNALARLAVARGRESRSDIDAPPYRVDFRVQSRCSLFEDGVRDDASSGDTPDHEADAFACRERRPLALVSH